MQFRNGDRVEVLTGRSYATRYWTPGVYIGPDYFNNGEPYRGCSVVLARDKYETYADSEIRRAKPTIDTILQEAVEDFRDGSLEALVCTYGVDNLLAAIILAAIEEAKDV